MTPVTLGGIPGFAAAALTPERIGRKPTTALTALFLVCAAGAAYLYGTAADRTALFVNGPVMQCFMSGEWSCLCAYTPELHPTRARSTGAGFASAPASPRPSDGWAPSSGRCSPPSWCASTAPPWPSKWARAGS